MSTITNNNSYLPIPLDWHHDKHLGYQRHPLFQVLSHLSLGRLPITQKQEKIFEKSRRISLVTSRYLGPAGFALVISAACFAASASIPVRSYFPVSEDSYWNYLTPFFLSLLGAISGNVMGMIFTGTHPDLKSDVANQEQNELNQLQGLFFETGRYLINLYYSKKREKREAASQFAENIDLQKLHLFFQTTTTQQNASIEMFKVLEAAIEHVKKKGNSHPFHFFLQQEIRYQKTRTIYP